MYRGVWFNLQQFCGDDGIVYVKFFQDLNVVFLLDVGGYDDWLCFVIFIVEYFFVVEFRDDSLSGDQNGVGKFFQFYLYIGKSVGQDVVVGVGCLCFKLKGVGFWVNIWFFGDDGSLKVIFFVIKVEIYLAFGFNCLVVFFWYVKFQFDGVDVYQVNDGCVWRKVVVFRNYVQIKMFCERCMDYLFF